MLRGGFAGAGHEAPGAHCARVAEHRARSDSVEGLAQLMRAARLAGEVILALERDVEASGAVHVNELTPEDWAQLSSWPQVRPLERRRLLAAARAMA